MFDLTGRGALVTGATGGLGEAIAAGLHAQGAVVAISGTRQAKLDEVAAKLGDRVHALACNLADRDAVKQLVKDAETALSAAGTGGVDILVNNAGITSDNLMMLLKDDDWDRIIEVNLTSAFVTSRAAVRNMMKRRFGRIINMASVSGVVGNPGQANYAASKAGMIGMSKALAREVATRGVTVNCIAPGFIATPMTDALTDEQAAQIKQIVPAQAFGTPLDVAAACVYLASNESGYMTGQTLHINGGMAMS